MKRYTGTIDLGSDEVTVMVEPDQGAPYALPLRLDLRNHSPTGFMWGYHGSGPAQLGLAILVDAIGEERALRLYQQFKAKTVARWNRDEGWSITHAEVIAECELIERSIPAAG